MPYEIIGGVPAKHIGWRFSEDKIELLEKLKWWDMSDAEIKKHLDIFSVDKDYSDEKESMKAIEQIIRERNIES